MEEVRYRPIGIVHSPFKGPKGTPIEALRGASESREELKARYEGKLAELTLRAEALSLGRRRVATGLESRAGSTMERLAPSDSV